ncbi:MAG TPA: alpha/beta family hydrolase, partial [Euzebya sp.]|nr:alpha/beta family hydrolase [Euzebya sp.]
VDHWPRLTVPALLVSGTRDAMAPGDSLRASLDAHMPPGLATLHPVAGADHSFKVRRKDGRTQEEALAECAQAVHAWLRQLATSVRDQSRGESGSASP